MTCHRSSKRLLRATGVGLVGILAAAGCGGGSNPPSPDAKLGGGADAYVPPPQNPDATPAGPEVSQPVLRVTQGALNFGQVEINTISPALVANVTNTGGLVALSPTIQGPEFTIVDNTCANPAASCTISVKFAPLTLGAASGTLTIAPNLSVSLSGVGTAKGSFSVVPDTIPTTLLVNESAPITVRVTTTAVLTGLTCVASGADLTANPGSTTCAASIPAATPCAFGFTFKASAAGEKADSIVCSAGTDTRTVLVGPTVVTPPSLALNPTQGMFSSAVNAPSAVITFNLANSGGSISGALTAALGGANASEFSITDNRCVVPLVPLGVCAIQVVFNPTTPGSKTATLTVTDATAGSTPTTATLSGTAIAGPTAIITGTANLGSVIVGQAGTATTFTVTNTGGSATGPLAIAVGDLSFTIGSDLCSGQSLSPAKTCTFTVTFTPKSVDVKSAVVTVSSGGTPLGQLQIQGTGLAVPVPAALTMAPPTLDFGSIGVGTVSPTQIFTVTNTGGLPTGVLSVAKSDSTSSVGGASQFSYTTTCQAALAPKATCQIVVTYSPTLVGNASATFAVSDGTTTSPTRTVVGIGLTKPGISMVCAPTTFADTAVGQTSAAVVCTVTNSANSVQATGTLTASTTGDFAVTTNGCSTSLAAGLSCTLSVVFKPTAKGARAGTVSVAGSNGGAANANLSGNGLGVIEIQEFTTAGSPVTGGIYDFGTVSAGGTAPTTVILAVFVRASVGNLAVANAFDTPADFTQVAGPVSLTWPGTSTPQSVPACIAQTTTAIAPNALVPYCTVTVAFSPQSKTPTQKTGTVTATGGDGSKDTATVLGEAAGPISITPSAVTFGAVALGASSAAQVLQVCNSSASPATNAKFTITGNAGDFAVTQDQVSGATIPGRTAGGVVSCANLAIRADIPSNETVTSPSATVTVSATVAGVTESDTATLSATVASGAVLTASLGGPFASTPISATSPAATVTVSNIGGVGTHGLSFTIPPGSEFTMLDAAGNPEGTCALSCTAPGTCTAPALGPAKSCTMNVWLTPTSALGAGKRNDTLTIESDNAGIKVLQLSGTATNQLTATPTALTLGLSSSDGANQPTKTVTIQNYGAAMGAGHLVLSFQDVGTQTGTLNSAFQIVTNTCNGGLGAAGSISPADNCTVTLSMSSGVDGTFSTTLVATDDLTQESVSAVVTGTSVKPATLVFTPATAMNQDFGTVRTGAVSASVTYTVTNTGGFTSGAIGFGLYDGAGDGGANPGTLHTGDFAFLTTPTTSAAVCKADGTTTLAPGASCDIVVQFAPVAATPSTLSEFLVVKATPGTSTTGVEIGSPAALPTVAAATTAAGVVYLTYAPTATTTSAGPYNYGLVTAVSADVVLTIHNATGASAPLTTPTFSASGNGEFTRPGTTGACVFGTNLAAGGTCFFTVRWTPTAAGVTREVTVATSGASIVLFGRKPGPAVLTASPTPLNFGEARESVAATNLTLVVTNTGESDVTGNLAVSKTGTAGAQAQLNRISGCDGAGLAAGAHCNLVASVTPTALGASPTVGFLVRSATVATETVSIPVTWTGTTAPGITAKPTAVAFSPPSQAVLATSAATTITLTNAAGGEPTGPLTFSIDDADFAVDAVAGGIKCGDAAFAVNGLDPSTGGNGGVCTVTVTFTPLALATPAKTGTLTVTSTSGASVTVKLTGTATAALSLNDENPASAAEDPLRTGNGCNYAGGTCTYPGTSITATKYYSETYTFQNAAGTPPTGLLMADLGGTGAAHYRVVTDTCTGSSLPASGTCKVTVRFAPSGTGAKAATLTLSGTPGDSAVVNLTGTGNTN